MHIYHFTTLLVHVCSSFRSPPSRSDRSRWRRGSGTKRQRGEEWKRRKEATGSAKSVQNGYSNRFLAPKDWWGLDSDMTLGLSGCRRRMMWRRPLSSPSARLTIVKRKAARVKKTLVRKKVAIKMILWALRAESESAYNRCWWVIVRTTGPRVSRHKDTLTAMNEHHFYDGRSIIARRPLLSQSLWASVSWLWSDFFF